MNRGALIQHRNKHDFATTTELNFVEPLGDSSGMSVSRKRMPADKWLTTRQ